MELSEISHNNCLDYFQLLERYVFENDLSSLAFDEIFNNTLSIINQMCENTHSQINLMGHSQYWRKTDVGFTKGECSSTHILSEMVLSHNQFFDAPGILDDKRIINTPVVINGQTVKHYSAMPIELSDGTVVGTLSLMNMLGSSMVSKVQSTLSLMVKNVASQLELKLNNLSMLAQSLDNTYETSPDLSSSVDKNNLFSELDFLLNRAVHDMRSPVNAIRNVTSWIKEDMDDGIPDDHDKHFSMIGNSLKRMDRLLTDLSLFSKIGRKTLPAEKFNLQDIVNESCEVIAFDEQFTLSVQNIDVYLPKEATLFVLNHLLSNAVKHHDKEKGHIQINYVNELEHDLIIISDDGPGIPDVYHNKVFEAFQTLKSKDQTEGSGLGLTMIKKTLQSYGADINLVSEQGEGSIFTMIWPKNSSNVLL